MVTHTVWLDFYFCLSDSSDILYLVICVWNHLVGELTLGKLLNQGAAVDEGVEADVDDDDW